MIWCILLCPVSWLRSPPSSSARRFFVFEFCIRYQICTDTRISFHCTATIDYSSHFSSLSPLSVSESSSAARSRSARGELTLLPVTRHCGPEVTSHSGWPRDGHTHQRHRVEQPAQTLPGHQDSQDTVTGQLWWGQSAHTVHAQMGKVYDFILIWRKVNYFRLSTRLFTYQCKSGTQNT